jgi:hypothetical protein
MENLQIRTGQVCLNIVDEQGESRGIFKFNPEDIALAKRVVDIQAEISVKRAEFEKRIPECETPEQQLELMRETVDYFEGLIDRCFGEGSSKILFGDNTSLSMFNDFFDGITPYFKKAAQKRVAKYKKPSKK